MEDRPGRRRQAWPQNSSYLHGGLISTGAVVRKTGALPTKMDNLMPWNIWNVTQGRWMLHKSVRSSTLADEAIKDYFQREHPGEEFESRRVVPHLEQHGTKLMALKPSMIWRCAMDDLDRKKRNKEAGGVADVEHYAFHRKHVKKAESANDILRAAIADPAPGRNSNKQSTRLLYADVELLKSALR